MNAPCKTSATVLQGINREIAGRLDIAEGTVKKQVANALKILKDKLGPLFFLLYL